MIYAGKHKDNKSFGHPNLRGKKGKTRSPSVSSVKSSFLLSSFTCRVHEKHFDLLQTCETPIIVKSTPTLIKLNRPNQQTFVPSPFKAL